MTQVALSVSTFLVMFACLVGLFLEDSA